MIPPYSIVILLVIFFVIAWTINATTDHSLNKIPGPWYARWTEARLKYASITGRRIHYIESLHQKYGPYVRVGPNEVAINDVSSFRHIHGLNSGFDKSHFYARMLNTTDRPNTFMMQDAKTHAARRRLLARGFSKSNVRQHWEDTIKKTIDFAISRIQSESIGGRSVDVLKWWNLMTGDISTCLMFGSSFSNLERGESNEMMRALLNSSKASGIRAELPWLAEVLARLPFRATKELFDTMGVMGKYAQIAVENMKSGDRSSRNIFTQIQEEAEKGMSSLTDGDVRVEAVGSFIAGTETTAITLTYLVYAVCSRPELQQKLTDEVSALPQDFKDTDVEKLPLLNAVIEETLRLYGAAPSSLPRLVPTGGVRLGGYYFPEGAVVSTQAYSLHRLPHLFPDPSEFDPSRWMTDPNVSDSSAAEQRPRLSQEAKQAWSTFGHGPRICLGMHIAYMELRLATAEFFRRLRGVTLAPSVTKESMEFENYFTITPKGHKCEIVISE